MSNTEKTRNHKSREAVGCKPSDSGKRTSLYLIVGVVAVFVAAVILSAPLLLSGSKKDATVYIPRDATKAQVSDTLHKYFEKGYADRVMFMIKAQRIDLSKRYGAYFIPEGTSPFRAMRKLSRGAQTPVRLTINHFRDFNALSEAIGAKIDASPEEFRRAATDPKFLAEYGLTPDQALSLFIEDSYDVYWSTTPEEIVKKIAKNYTGFWNDENRRKAAAKGLTPGEVMIIASIADEESNMADEKGRIGQLYINRLNKGMRLQADPTVRYAVGDFTIKRVTSKHLQTESPYNTYLIDGLPPAPIRTTSKRTLQAILDEGPSDELYMCAREDFSGYHNFAADYATHTQNALRYQHALDQRNIK